jgi:hypothetical protein
MYVTTTVPPANAVIIETTHHNLTETELEELVVLGPTQEELRAEMESVLSAETVSYWQNIDKSLLSARSSGNLAEPHGTIDAVFNDTLWGDGLWILTLLPVAIMGVFLFSAYWICIGLPKTTKALVWTLFSLLGLLLSHVGMHRSLYLPQAKRLDFMMSMMPHYLGGFPEIKPSNLQAMSDHAEALLIAADPMAPMTPTWVFPLEIYRARNTLRSVAADP